MEVGVAIEVTHLGNYRVWRLGECPRTRHLQQLKTSFSTQPLWAVPTTEAALGGNDRRTGDVSGVCCMPSF